MSSQLKPEVNAALKEWAVVCEAVSRGEQTVLLRTGGIEESESGFEIKQRSFWLFPTQFHQLQQSVSPEFAARIADITLPEPENGMIPISIFCEVVGIHFLSSIDQLKVVRPWHILSDEVVEQRFHYRTPGIFALTIQGFRRSTPTWIQDQPRFAGCHSWVELSQALSTTDLIPVRTRDQVLEVDHTLARLLNPQ